MTTPFHRVALLLLGIVVCSAVHTWAAPPMQLVLATEDGFDPTDSQRWLQFLAKLDLTSIRIRQAESGDRESITNRGTEARPSYYVVGILTSRNRLRLPGGEFSLADRERLAAWLNKIETDGAAGPTQKTAAFGLTAEQLVAFHEKISVPIACETKDRRCGDVARDIVKGIQLEFAVSDGAKKAFGSDELCGDDLRGLSAGTALAAAIRPIGLVVRPEKSGKNVRLWICEVRETEEAWPVGWPSEETPVKTAPKLFESLNVDIKGVALSKAIDAIQPRVGIPFLFDHNGIARQRIDIATAKVKYPSGRAMYQKVLSSLLSQAKLSSDLRVDEAGKPFLWISPR